MPFAIARAPVHRGALQLESEIKLLFSQKKPVRPWVCNSVLKRQHRLDDTSTHRHPHHSALLERKCERIIYLHTAVDYQRDKRFTGRYEEYICTDNATTGDCIAG